MTRGAGSVQRGLQSVVRFTRTDVQALEDPELPVNSLLEGPEFPVNSLKWIYFGGLSESPNGVLITVRP